MNRSNRPAVPRRRLPVGDDAVVAAVRAAPRDTLVGPQAVLDDSRAGSMLRPATAPDRRGSFTVGGRRSCGHDGCEVLRQPASGAGKEWREVAGLVDEVTQV